MWCAYSGSSTAFRGHGGRIELCGWGGCPGSSTIFIFNMMLMVREAGDGSY
jgi:hypothetical protein